MITKKFLNVNNEHLFFRRSTLNFDRSMFVNKQSHNFFHNFKFQWFQKLFILFHMDDLDDFVIKNSNSQLKTKKCNNTHAKVKTSEEQETLTISSKWEGSKLVEEIKKAYPCQILFQK